MCPPDADDGTIECLIKRRGGVLAAGGAVSCQGLPFQSGSPVKTPGGGFLANGSGVPFFVSVVTGP